MKKFYAVIVSYVLFGASVAHASVPTLTGAVLDCCALALPCCAAGGCC